MKVIFDELQTQEAVAGIDREIERLKAKCNKRKTVKRRLAFVSRIQDLQKRRELILGTIRSLSE